MYNSDPSGNYAAWKAHATGKGCVTAISTLKDEFKAECNLNEALVLAAQVLAKSMDSATPSADKYEIGVMQKDKDGNLVQRRIEGEELKAILDKAKVFEQAAGK